MSTIDIIAKFKQTVVQIATPYSTGTGFVLPTYHLIVTNEHVVRDNKEVVIVGQSIEKQLVKVVYLDEDSDLAFLHIPELPDLPDIELYNGDGINVGSEVIAVGHPFGLEFSVTKGIVSSLDHQVSNIQYIQHDAALNPGNSGGPLITKDGQVVGMNTFVLKNGSSIGFSLPYTAVKSAITDYQSHTGRRAMRCTSCQSLVIDDEATDHCTQCGTAIKRISSIENFDPQGVNKSLEQMIQDLGYDINLSRTGPSSWLIKKGSATIRITYHEKSGLITGDAHLCNLPQEDILDIYTFLLGENYRLDGLTFSVKDRDIILSLLIYDQYFQKENASKFFEDLFTSADDYDNILVERFGARWDSESKT